jgi:hypothetical protein
MPQEIGENFKSLIPSLSDEASIEQAFQMYHYGTPAYNGSNLQNNSIEKHFVDLEEEINVLRSELNFSQLGNVKLISQTLNPNIITSEDLATVPVTVRGVQNQAVALQRWQRNLGGTPTEVGSVSALGAAGFAGYASFGNSVVTNTTGISLTLANAAHKGIAVRGVDGQTENLQEWQSNNGTALASISAIGNFSAKNTSITGTLSVTSNATLGGELSVTGNTSLGNTAITGTFTAPKLDLTDSVSLTVAGTSSFSDNVTITGLTTSVRDLSISGVTTSTGSIATTGDLSAGGAISGSSLSVTNAGSVGGNFSVAGILRAKSPGQGTTGGLRVVADSDGDSYIQFTNATDTTELANIRVNSTNILISKPISTSSISVTEAFNLSNSAKVRNIWSAAAAPIAGSNDVGSIDGDIWLNYV